MSDDLWIDAMNMMMEDVPDPFDGDDEDDLFHELISEFEDEDEDDLFDDLRDLIDD